IRRRSRPIVTPAPTSSGSRPHHRENFTDVNVDREIDDAQTNPLTAGPSISADVNDGQSARPRAAFYGYYAVPCLQATTNGSPTNRSGRISIRSHSRSRPLRSPRNR